MRREIMNIVEFREYVAGHVKDYLPEENRNAEITTGVVEKNNGLKLQGVCIRPAGSAVGSNLYMEQYYHEWLSGTEMEDILTRIASNYLDSIEMVSVETAKRALEFEVVKDRIIAEVINSWRNRDRLGNMPHTDKEDLSIIYKILLEGGGTGRASITITNNILEKWENIDEKGLHELAMENTKKLCPLAVKPMNEVLREMLMSDYMPEDLVDMLDIPIPTDEMMYVITNQSRTNGAVSMFFDESLAEVAACVGHDLYVIPSSIHECIAVSSGMKSPSELAEMVRVVNYEQVAAEEQLSDHVYFYDRSKHELTIADDKNMEAHLNQYQVESNEEGLGYIHRGR